MKLWKPLLFAFYTAVSVVGCTNDRSSPKELTSFAPDTLSTTWSNRNNSKHDGVVFVCKRQIERELRMDSLKSTHRDTLLNKAYVFLKGQQKIEYIIDGTVTGYTEYRKKGMTLLAGNKFAVILLPSGESLRLDFPKLERQEVPSQSRS